MRDPLLLEFIEENKSLFWYTPESGKKDISDELLLETIINYAELDCVLKLFSIMGDEKVKSILESMTGRKRNNIYPELYNFFMEYLKRVA